MAIVHVASSTAKTVTGMTATSRDCPVPTGTLPGHVELAWVAAQTPADNSEPAFTPPSGWTLVGQVFDAGGTGTVGSKLALYRHVAANGDTSNPAWSWGGVGLNVVIEIDAYSGVNTAAPITGSEFAFGATTGTARVTPSVTTAGARLLASAFTDRSGSTFTGAADTQRLQDRLNSSTSLLVQDTDGQVVAGSYTKSATASIASTVGAAGIVALTPGTNVAPSANAGNDQIVSPGATVTLTGTSSDSDGTVSSVAWTQDGANPTTVTLSGAATSTATFTAPATKGRYVFHFTATDNLGSATVGNVTIVVTTTAARPDSETATSGTWTIAGGAGSTTVALNDESDATYIEGTGTTGAYKEFRFDGIASGSPTITTRLASNTAGVNASVTTELRQGATVIASWTDTSNTTTPADVTHTLTTTQLAAITDRSNLRIRYTEV